MSAISYMIGGFFELTAVGGIALNISVLLAIAKGGLFRSMSSPIYILSSQTMIVDIIMLLLHMFESSEIIFQKHFYSPNVQTEGMAPLDFIMLYCWYHNSLSHILVALNRFSIIVFERTDVFTRKRTIIICVLQHLFAVSLSITSQFLSPCCRMTFYFPVFTYYYITKGDMINYSNNFIEIPLASTCTIISMMVYIVIIRKMVIARKNTASIQKNVQRKNQEYKLAIQFATMAIVYSSAWIYFRVFPFLFGQTDKLYVYGIITFLVEINSLMNAVVYIINNAEIKKSLRAMLGNSTGLAATTHVNTITTVERQTSINQSK